MQLTQERETVVLKNSLGGKIALSWLGTIIFCAIFGPLLPIAGIGQTFNDGVQLKPFTNCGFMGPLAQSVSGTSDSETSTQPQADTSVVDESATQDTAPIDTESLPGSTVAPAFDDDGFTEETLPPDLSGENSVDAEQQERDRQELIRSLQMSNRCFVFGTTTEGTDIFAALIHGTRTSLSISFLSVFFGGLIGCLLGITAAYTRGWFDRIVFLVFNIILSIPTLVLAFALIAIFATPLRPDDTVPDSTKIRVLIGSLVIILIPQLGRIARSAALQWINRDFVIASRSIGSSHISILFKRIIPNVLPSIFAVGFLALGAIIVIEGSLSLLGVGLNSGNSWGSLIARNSGDFIDYPHVVYIPVIVIAFTVISVNKIGDLIRQSLDNREAKI